MSVPVPPGAPPSGLTFLTPSSQAFQGTGVLGVPFLPVPRHRALGGREGKKQTRKNVLFGHQERKGVGTPRGWGRHIQRGPPPCRLLFFLVPTPSPKLRAPSCVLGCPSQCHPHPGHSHTLHAVRGTQIFLPNGPCPTFPPAEGAQATLPCLLPRGPPQQYPRGGPMPTVHEAA